MQSGGETGDTLETVARTNGGVKEINKLRSSLGVTLMDRIKNDYIRGTNTCKRF